MKFEYEKALARADALEEMLGLWKPQPSAETVLLDEACGRVTAADVTARFSLPVVRSSKRDGIAVKSADFANGLPDTTAWVRGRDFAQADTGDDFPDEFDAVVARENVEWRADGTPELIDDGRLGIAPGEGVNESGSIVSAGSPVVAAGTRLTPELVAACAVAGQAQLSVVRKPRVAFLATGSELVPWGSYPKRGQNIEANSLMVAGTVREWGGECACYPVVCDDAGQLEDALDRALAAADIVIINGGSSRGEEDFNSYLLERRGSHFRHGVRAVPGRPVGMAIIDGKPVVNVPGPVGAAFLCMDWLIRGLIAHWLGVPAPQRQRVSVRLVEPLKKPAPFERLVRMVLSRAEDGVLEARALPGDTGVPRMIAESDAMLSLPIGSAGAEAGDMVEVELLRPLEVIGLL